MREIVRSMLPLTAENFFEKSATALLLNQDDSIDWPLMDNLVTAVVGFHLKGIYPNGASDEFSSQTESEFECPGFAVTDKSEQTDVPLQLRPCHGSPELSCYFALDKLLTEIGGWTKASTCVRWPYLSIPKDKRGRLRSIASQTLLEFFEPFTSSRIHDTP